MNVKKTEYYVFLEADKAEKAINAMRRALGKKNEQAAAVKFAHAMLDLYGERKEIEDQRERKRLDLLFAYYKIHAVRNRVQEVLSWANDIASKIYDEYHNLGGNYIEDEVYRTGKTTEEVIARHNRKMEPLINTRTMTDDDKSKETTEGAA